jgi:hypothetical protein
MKREEKRIKREKRRNKPFIRLTLVAVALSSLLFFTSLDKAFLISESNNTSDICDTHF